MSHHILVKEIILSGIFGWEITPEAVRESLSSAKGGDIEVSLASAGGDVFGGVDIYNQFSDYKRKNPDSQMILKMSGIVASMGAYLAMNPSFDLVTAEDNAAFMIHNAWTFSMGDFHVLRKDADKLEGLSKPMTELVASKMGISFEDAGILMKEETWLFGKDIVSAGLADEIIARPEGESTRDKKSSKAELKKIQSSISKKTYADLTNKVAASITKNDIFKTNKPEVNTEMADQEEIKKASDEAVKAEKDRVNVLMELKKKYSDAPYAQSVSDIVDKAISDGTEKADVLAEIVLKATNGNALAAGESPEGTPQGGAGTISGENKKTEHNYKTQFGGQA